MHEYIFTRTALNEAIPLCAVKPLNRTLFLHDLLLSHPVTKKIQGSKKRGTSPKLWKRAHKWLEPSEGLCLSG
jgi:hypothetical protein